MSEDKINNTNDIVDSEKEDKDEYEKFKLKEEKNKHPLNHYDIFYSSINSFKLGLKKEISHEDFINILNTNKDCKYIEK